METYFPHFFFLCFDIYSLKNDMLNTHQGICMHYVSYMHNEVIIAKSLESGPYPNWPQEGSIRPANCCFIVLFPLRLFRC